MCFSISMDNGAILTVCTLNFNNAPVTENVFTALINNHELFKAEKTVSVAEFKKYLEPLEMTDFNAEVILPDLQSSHFSRLERQQRRRKRNCNVLAQSERTRLMKQLLAVSDRHT